jgi:FAD synthetase
MTANSACQHQHDARINGVTKTDAPVTAHATIPRALPAICFDLRAKIDAFLSEQPDDDVLRNVQRQIRVSMGVIHESLRRYGYVIR